MAVLTPQMHRSVGVTVIHQRQLTAFLFFAHHTLIHPHLYIYTFAFALALTLSLPQKAANTEVMTAVAIAHVHGPFFVSEYPGTAGCICAH